MGWFGVDRNCNLGSVMMMNNMQVPHSWVRRICREEKKFGKARVNPESMAFCWLSPWQERSSLLFLLGSAVVSWVWELPSPNPNHFLVSQLYLIELLFIKFYSCKLYVICVLDTVPPVHSISHCSLQGAFHSKHSPASGSSLLCFYQPAPLVSHVVKRFLPPVLTVLPVRPCPTTWYKIANLSYALISLSRDIPSYVFPCPSLHYSQSSEDRLGPFHFTSNL